MKPGGGHNGGLTICFLATLATVTWEKVRWAPSGGDILLCEFFAALFVVLFLADRLRRRDAKVARRAVHVGVFALAFLLVYLFGFFNLDTKEALDQFVKGLAKFVLHFAFVVAGTAYVVRRGEDFLWRSLRWFIGGMAVNAAYGILQLVAAHAGHNLDALVLEPVTHGASKIDVYGAVQGSIVYRPNAMTGDPNHLAIMLDLALLILVPLYLRLGNAHRVKSRLAALIAVVLLADLTTLSRSGILGLVAGALVLAFPYRRWLTSRTLLMPLGAVAVVAVTVVLRQLNYFETVFRSRFHTTHAGVHFAVYDFIPQILHSHPLLGLGLNNFSVYYEFVTGKKNWGPHSFYVAVIVESGLVGAFLFVVFMLYLFLCLGKTRQLGRTLAAAGDPVAARVRPLAWGLTAGLVATLAANSFYLTMTFFYFNVFVIFVLATPSVFRRQLTRPVGEGAAVGSVSTPPPLEAGAR